MPAKVCKRFEKSTAGKCRALKTVRNAAVLEKSLVASRRPLFAVGTVPKCIQAEEKCDSDLANKERPQSRHVKTVRKIVRGSGWNPKSLGSGKICFGLAARIEQSSAIHTYF